MRAPRLGLPLALVLLLGAGCSFLHPDLTDPSSVPPGFSAVPAGGCGVAFPSDWKRNALVDGQLLYEGTSGRGALDVFAEPTPQRPDEPLPEFVGYFAKTTVRVSSQEAASVPGADSAFRLRLAGADGSTHLAGYAYVAKEQRACWVLVTPADQTGEQAVATLTVEGG